MKRSNGPKMERIPKLPIGQKNVLIKKCPVRKAKGADLLKGWDKQKTAPIETPFNTPSICIVLRKVA